MITNFKPNVISEFYNINNLKRNNNNRLLCKNFLTYLLMIKFKNSNILSYSSLYVKKIKRKTYTILRSPYRHKLARNQFVISRYIIKSKITLNKLTVSKIINFSSVIKIINYIMQFNKVFESNLIYIHSYSFSLPLKFSNNFFLSKHIK